MGMPGFTSTTVLTMALAMEESVLPTPPLVVALSWEEIPFWCREYLAKPEEKRAGTLGQVQEKSKASNCTLTAGNKPLFVSLL